MIKAPTNQLQGKKKPPWFFANTIGKPGGGWPTFISFLVTRSQVPSGPTLGSKYVAMRKELELGARFRLLALEGGERGVLEVSG